MKATTIAATAGLALAISATGGAVALARTTSVTATPAPTPAPATPVATRTPASTTATAVLDPVGPLFVDGLASGHSCTASVVASPAGDVIVTAAHCLSGSGVGAVFAPGYHDGTSPHGTWTVTAAYVEPGWTATQDPQADVAFLLVTGDVQAVVGAEALGTAPAAGQSVTVTGYASTSGTATVCTAPTTLTGAWPTFTCGRFAGGTSGGPWVSDGTVVGVIGGLHQGGCTDPVSYSSVFGPAVRAVYDRAVAGGKADVLPVPDGDGCT